MLCDVCKVEMNDSTTEMEISVKERKVKAVNVPAMVCPKCNKLVVEELVDKLVRKAAKHCKDDTFDYPKEVKVFGFGFGKAKL
ncbi:MAG: YgiT-type zinc finger protein [Oscillospiraceae bacterium]|nr:YgiT-type zinc finger protein [Oscillospiraceae bacterium]